jgi:hypothetical protein
MLGLVAKLFHFAITVLAFQCGKVNHVKGKLQTIYSWSLLFMLLAVKRLARSSTPTWSILGDNEKSGMAKEVFVATIYSCCKFKCKRFYATGLPCGKSSIAVQLLNGATPLKFNTYSSAGNQRKMPLLFTATALYI